MRGFGNTGQGATDAYETTLNTNVTKRTFFIRSRADGSVANQRFFDKRTVSAQSDVLLWAESGSLQYSTNFSGGERQVYWPLPALGRTVFIALVTDYANTNAFGDHIQLFYDGVKQSVVNAVNSAGSYLATADNYVIGNRTNDFARVFNGLHSDFLVWDRAVPDAEIREISVNPWQLFTDDTEDLLIFDMGAGGAGSHTLTGANSTQSNTGTTAAITQVHNIAGANSVQANTASTGSIGNDITLAGAAGSSANTGSTGAIAQVHVLAGAAGSQANTAGTGAVTQTHALTGADGTQTNTGSTGAITQTHVLIGAASVQDNIAAASAIVQAHVLAGGSAVQGNLGSVGAVVVGDFSDTPSPYVALVPYSNHIALVPFVDNVAFVRADVSAAIRGL